MKKYLTLLAMMMLPMTILAQEATDSLFKGKFKNAELNIQCQLNLYDEAIEVPGLELEMCYGFLQGQINGCWMFLKVKEKVTAESLEIQQEDGYIKGVKGNKYVKLPKTLVLTRQ